MGKRRGLLILAVAGMLWSAGAWAADLDDLFVHSNGARPAGMGDAFVAVANDSNAVYYNPAGLGFMESSEISTMTSSDGLIDRTTNMLSYVHRLGHGPRSGAVGIKFVLDDFGQTPVAVTSSGGRPVVTLADESETKYMFAYGMQFDDNLSVGATLKGVNYEIGGYSASGWGLDVGALYRLEGGLSLGINLQNIMETSVGNDAIPLNIKAGLAYQALEDNLTLAMDFDSNVGGGNVMHAGLDYRLTPEFSFRMGLNDSDLTVGLGVSMSNLALDYAFRDRDEGDINVISLSYRIPAAGERRPRSAAEPVRPAPVAAGKTLDTRVAMIEGGRALINLGNTDGLAVGMVVDIYSRGRKAGSCRIEQVGKFFAKGRFDPGPGVSASPGQDVGDQIIIP